MGKLTTHVLDTMNEAVLGQTTDGRFLTRRTLWHWRSVLRFVRKHPERLRLR